LERIPPSPFCRGPFFLSVVEEVAAHHVNPFSIPWSLDSYMLLYEKSFVFPITFPGGLAPILRRERQELGLRSVNTPLLVPTRIVSCGLLPFLTPEGSSGGKTTKCQDLCPVVVPHLFLFTTITPTCSLFLIFHTLSMNILISSFPLSCFLIPWSPELLD